MCLSLFFEGKTSGLLDLFSHVEKLSFPQDLRSLVLDFGQQEGEDKIYFDKFRKGMEGLIKLHDLQYLKLIFRLKFNFPDNGNFGFENVFSDEEIHKLINYLEIKMPLCLIET